MHTGEKEEVTKGGSIIGDADVVVDDETGGLAREEDEDQGEEKASTATGGEGGENLEGEEEKDGSFSRLRTQWSEFGRGGAHGNAAGVAHGDPHGNTDGGNTHGGNTQS